ncbi:uncharacterized protein LOC142172047 [Nicotiana tabacum]|uniref:Uncharacterized protein LOC142172047 n=1 Tax=Nicotiana tabacum TaxID=4097 RepID=A0AC58T3V8_TOBAC
MGEIKSLADELAATRSPLTSEELTIKVLSGLGPEYNEISAAIRARDTPISFEELYDKLLGHEVFLKHEDAKKEQLTITAQLIYRSSSNNRPRGNNFNSNRRTFFTTGQLDNQHRQQNGYLLRQSNNQRVQCQLYDKFGHILKVERYFNTSIRSIYSDGGGKYIDLRSLLNRLANVTGTEASYYGF